MKKIIAILLTVIGGLLANAIICAAGVFLYPMSIFIYAAAELLLLFIYGGLLIAVTGLAAERSAVSRKALYICAQAPFLAVISVNFIKQLVTYDPPSGSGIFGGWRYVNLGLSLGIAVCMLVTSVLTTAFAFIMAAVVKKKGIV